MHTMQFQVVQCEPEPVRGWYRHRKCPGSGHLQEWGEDKWSKAKEQAFQIISSSVGKQTANSRDHRELLVKQNRVPFE